MRSIEDQQRIQLGNHAEQLQAQDCFQAVMASLKADYIRQFTDSKPASSEERELVYFQYQAIAAIETELRSRIQQRNTVLARENMPPAKY